MSATRKCYDPEQIETIREALLLGLAFFGEWLERSNAFETHMFCAEKPPQDLKPIDVVGHEGGVSIFASALRDLELFESTAATNGA